MSTIITTVNIVVNVLILAFLAKLTLNARDFFFNPILQPIDQVTSPVLRVLGKLLRPTQTGWDYTPIPAIILLIFAEVSLFYALTGSGFMISLAITLQNVIGFFMQFFTICMLAAILIENDRINPVAKFLSSLLKPLQRILTAGISNRRMQIGAAYSIVIIIGICLWHTVSFIQVSHQSSINFFNPQLVKNSVVMALMRIVLMYRFLVMLIVINWILSWVRMQSGNAIVQIIFALTEPILSSIRRILPTLGGLDFSPMIAILFISFVGRLLTGILGNILITGLR